MAQNSENLPLEWAAKFGKLAHVIWKNLTQNTVIPIYHCYTWQNISKKLDSKKQRSQ